MKIINSLIFVFFLSLMPMPGLTWIFSESLEIDNLVERNGLYYKKFEDTPFSGKVVGMEKGKIKKGKRVGEWSAYYFDGNLQEKGTYKNGKKNGKWVYISRYGAKSEGEYVDGLREGLWKLDGETHCCLAEGFYKNGVKSGSWKGYDWNGKLLFIGSYVNDKKDGYWEWYRLRDGSVDPDSTGTYRNGKMISRHPDAKIHCPYEYLIDNKCEEYREEKEKRKPIIKVKFYS